MWLQSLLSGHTRKDTKMNEKRFAIRTIKHGTVKIGGRIFYPDQNHLVYDGRLDGLRYTFGRYLGSDGEYLPFVYLWGTEANYHGDEQHHGPELVEGYFPWNWWRTKSTPQALPGVE